MGAAIRQSEYLVLTGAKDGDGTLFRLNGPRPTPWDFLDFSDDYPIRHD
jgi:hypothetical protein